MTEATVVLMNIGDDFTMRGLGTGAGCAVTALAEFGNSEHTVTLDMLGMVGRTGSVTVEATNIGASQNDIGNRGVTLRDPG